MFDMEAARKALEFRNTHADSGGEKAYDVLLSQALYEIERLQKILSRVVSGNYDDQERLGRQIEGIKAGRQIYVKEASEWQGKYQVARIALKAAQKLIGEALIRTDMKPFK